MKFRIKKDEDNLYYAERKIIFFWWYVRGSYSLDIEETKAICVDFSQYHKRHNIVEKFEC